MACGREKPRLMRVRRCWGGQALWPSPRPTNPLGRQPWLAPGAIEPMTKGADKGVLEHAPLPRARCTQMNTAASYWKDSKDKRARRRPPPKQWAAWGLLAGEARWGERHREGAFIVSLDRACRQASKTVTRRLSTRRF